MDADLYKVVKSIPRQEIHRECARWQSRNPVFCLPLSLPSFSLPCTFFPFHPSHLPLLDAQRQVIVVLLRCALSACPQNHAILRVRLDAQIQIDIVAYHLAHGIRIVVVEVAIGASETGAEILAHALHLRLMLGGQIELLEETPIGVRLRGAVGS